MSNSINEFQALWQAGNQGDSPGAKSVIERVRDPQRETVRAQIGTIVILLVIVVVLILFFRYLSPVEESLSIIGKGLMIGSIATRILIELIGLVLAEKIDFFESAATFIKESRRLVRYRAGVHQYVVILTFVLYSVGYYLIMPEWSNYFNTPMIWLLIISYLVIMALVIFLAIRPGMQRENAALFELETLTDELGNGESGR